MVLLECKGLSDFVWRQVVGDHAGIVELSPLLVGEVEDFGLAYGQRDNKSVWQIAEYSQETTLRRSIRQEASLTMTHVTGSSDR